MFEECSDCSENCGEGTYYEEDSGTCLPVVPGCSADVTGDGLGNVADLLILLSQFGDICEEDPE